MASVTDIYLVKDEYGPIIFTGSLDEALDILHITRDEMPSLAPHLSIVALGSVEGGVDIVALNDMIHP